MTNLTFRDAIEPPYEAEYPFFDRVRYDCVEAHNKGKGGAQRSPIRMDR
jgi:hypothetical protein